MQPLFYVDSSTFLNKLFVPCRLHVVSRNLTEAIPGHGSVKNADVIDICFFNVVTTPTHLLVSLLQIITIGNVLGCSSFGDTAAFFETRQSITTRTLK